MLILDKPKKFNSPELRIPLYHRGHLSLLAGTKVWLCLLPGTKSPSHIPEIIVSPINFDSWTDLWRIEATLDESIGVVHKILRVLREHSVNVLAQESSSIDRQRYHMIELIIDARRHNSVTDCDSGKRSLGIVDALPDLQRALLAELMDHITFWPTGAPRLKISRMKGLHEAAQAFDIAHRNYLSGLGFRPTVEHTKAEVKDAKGWITLPNDILRILEESLWPTGRPDDISKPSRHPSYLLVSDTKERYLRTYFMRPTDAILSVAVEHEEKVGALATITDALKLSNFNILTSLSRLYTHGGRAQYELVLQSPPGLGDNPEVMIREFEKALGTRELISEYKIAVSYKSNYTSPLDFKVVRENTSASSAQSPQEPPRSVEEILDRHQSALALRTRSVGASEEDMLRFNLSGKLLDEERRVRQAYRPRKILFLSFAFDHSSSYVEKAFKEAASLGFEVTTGRGMKELVHREGIIRLIKGATAFLGIWSDEGAYRFGGKSWPSPWLHWELGVSAAQGLRPRLLISSTVHKDAWKVYPEVPHLTFTSATFADCLRDTLEYLAADQI